MSISCHWTVLPNKLSLMIQDYHAIIFSGILNIQILEPEFHGSKLMSFRNAFSAQKAVKESEKRYSLEQGPEKDDQMRQPDG